PPIDGLDLTIAVLPRRLHLTLGVMARAPLPSCGASVDLATEPERELAETALM
ncbi:hypothetical protein BJY52DRAFT_1127428, partial [Lactarius psammicola]